MINWIFRNIPGALGFGCLGLAAGASKPIDTCGFLIFASLFFWVWVEAHRGPV